MHPPHWHSKDFEIRQVLCLTSSARQRTKTLLAAWGSRALNPCTERANRKPPRHKGAKHKAENMVRTHSTRQPEGTKTEIDMQLPWGSKNRRRSPHAMLRLSERRPGSARADKHMWFLPYQNESQVRKPGTARRQEVFLKTKKISQEIFNVPCRTLVGVKG